MKAAKVFALFVVATLMVSCCHVPLLGEAKARDEAARQWLHGWGSAHDYSWTQTMQWVPVTQSKLPDAERLLLNAAWVQLNGQQVSQLSGTNETKKVSANPYLLRAVGDARRRFPVEVFEAEGYVWVGGGANNYCGSVPMERRAIVIWLEQPPKDVFVTFVVGK